MTSFFSSTATADLALIIKAVRSHDDIATVAMQSESDVIAHYTRRLPPDQGYENQFYQGRGYHKGLGIWVALEGFNPDASLVDTAHADLKTALKWTIADVINWRLAKTGLSPVLKSGHASAGVYKEHRDDINEPFPPGEWYWRLQPWAMKLPVYTF